MSAFPFKVDRKLTDVLGSDRFTLSAEIIPPRNGAQQAVILDQIQTLMHSGAEFMAVTKGAGGSLRGGSLPIAQLIKERFQIPCIAHFTCRDLNAHEVENALMDHHYFGIRNILALRGDPPDGQPDWQPRAGGYHYAYQLIEQIQKLNAGSFLPRSQGPQNDTDQKTDFCIGAAAYPDFPNPAQRLEFFRLKVQAGAQFGVTDLLFDPESYARFLDQCGKQGVSVPILPGTRILKTRTQALKMAAKFKTQIPRATLDQLDEHEGPDSLERGVDVFLHLADRLKVLGAPGIHLYVITDTQSACIALRRLADRKKRDREDSPLAGVAK